MTFICTFTKLNKIVFFILYSSVNRDIIADINGNTSANSNNTWSLIELNRDKRRSFIPILDDPVQQGIAKAIQRSFKLRHESVRLLDVAKRVAEMAIELGEDAATKWVSDKNKGEDR